MPQPPAAVSRPKTPLNQRWMKIRKERLFNAWPWLVWLGIAGVVGWSYSRGHVFERMNGQVEEHYQFIAPAQGGHLLKIHVKPGDHVEPGGVVAELDPAPWILQIEGMLHGITDSQQEKLSMEQRHHGDVLKELNALNQILAEDEGRLSGISLPAKPPTGPLLMDRQQLLDERRAEAGEISARIDSTRQMVASLQARLTEIEQEIARRQEASKRASGVSARDNPQALLSLFSEEKQIIFQDILNGLEHCQIHSAVGGTVEKVVKTPGDYLSAGEALLEMVGNPKRITAFLSSEEAAALKPGDPVWVTPAHGRKWAVHETTVIRAAPDAERLPISSKAGKGAYQAGRKIVVAYPPSALIADEEGVPGLFPGEGITVHTSHPGKFSIFRKLGSVGD